MPAKRGARVFGRGAVGNMKCPHPANDRRRGNAKRPHPANGRRRGKMKRPHPANDRRKTAKGSTMSARRAKPTATHDLPLPVRPAFRRSFLDFERGIRMGGLAPNERITQIIKMLLKDRHAQDFVIDKWGRGRYWQWICWLPRANRDAKPRSSGYNFSCAKFFVALDRDRRELQAGLQIERATVHRGRGPAREVTLRDDWDYHRLMANLRSGTPLARELRRLAVDEGFTVYVGNTPARRATFRGRGWRGPAAVRRALEAVPDDDWGWFQVYYPTPEKELDRMTGDEIVATVLAVFDEVTPAMNHVMTEPCLRTRSPRGRNGETP